jgi:undecaprenyl-diphosphatase
MGVLAGDAALFRWIASWRTPWLDAPMLWASFAGDRAAVWLILAAVIAVLRRGPYAMAAWRLALAIGLSGLLVDMALKPTFARLRPFDAVADTLVLGSRPTTTSFPSGHATNAVVGAYALALVWRRPRALWWALATTIAVSRVYLGVHYPLDVVAGALFGWAIARFATAATPAVPA